jgi:8-oxo-dGTP diphosphatase
MNQPAETPEPKVAEVAIAILYQQNQFLLQLRDDIPTILYPGHWAFFGGHLESGESPVVALKRELLEEIGYDLPQATFFGNYNSSGIVRHVFAVPLVVDIKTLVLMEGWDLDFFTVEDIKRGDRFSERAGKVCPLGTYHQNILLDYLQIL